MRFEEGDIVICTGWDDIDVDENYNNKNVLDYYGVDRYSKFTVKKLYPNYGSNGENLISFNFGDMDSDFGLNENYFTLLSEIREKEIDKLYG